MIMRRHILLAATVLTFTSLLAGCAKKEAAQEVAQSSALLQPGRMISVGVDEEFPPIVFRDAKGELIGFDIDLSNEAFKRMGLKIEHRAVNWGTKDDELLKRKSIDMLWSGVNISEARKQLYAFSEPYLDNAQVVVVLAGSSIKALSDLSGRTVAHQSGSSLIPKLEAFQGASGPIGKLVPMPEYATMLVAMLQGKVDAVVMGEAALPSYIENAPGKFRVLDGNFGVTSMAVAMRKDDPEFMNKLNATLAAMKADGTIDRIRARWYPTTSK